MTLEKNQITEKEIRKYLEVFNNGNGLKNKGRGADERYSSFDYCFNYFQSFKDSGKISEIANEKNLQISCLHLGFYLASWGMLRGSSFLLEKSIRYFIPLIKLIAEYDQKIWSIDVDSYNTENIKFIIQCKNDISAKLRENKDVSDILTTKIMLGIFGNVPAFDSYFKNGFGFSYCKENQLIKISDFYKNNRLIINKECEKVKTIDFFTGKETNRHYTKAKIIDMIGFIKGQNNQYEK